MSKNNCAMKMAILIILIVSAILYFQSEYFSNTSLKNGLPEMVMVKGGNYQLNCGYKDTLSMRISLRVCLETNFTESGSKLNADSTHKCNLYHNY